jgi:hypothetical protein
MGLLKNIIEGSLGAGSGEAGAHNAYLAELAIKKLSASEKKRVAEETVEMGVRATGHRLTPEHFCDHFNYKDRLCQLNIIALALAEMDIHVLPNDSWRGIKNPFMLNIDSTDLEVSSHWFLKKHNLKVSVGNEQINIREWLTLKEADNEPPPSAPTKKKMGGLDWYCVQGEERKGPFSTSVIKYSIKHGQVNRSTLVWTEGMSDWLPAEETTLAQHFQQAPPPLPQKHPNHSPRPLRAEAHQATTVPPSKLFNCPKCSFEQPVGGLCCPSCGVIFKKIKKENSSRSDVSLKRDAFSPEKDPLYGLKGWLFVPAVIAPLILLDSLYDGLIHADSTIRNKYMWENLTCYTAVYTIDFAIIMLGGTFLLYLLYTKNKKYPFFWMLISLIGMFCSLLIIFISYITYNAETYNIIVDAHFKVIIQTFVTFLVWMTYFVRSKRVYVTFLKKDYRRRDEVKLSDIWRFTNDVSSAKYSHPSYSVGVNRKGSPE